MAGTIYKIPMSMTPITQHRWEKRGPPAWEMLNKLLDGGYIERVRVPFLGRMRDMWVDEDGLGKGLLWNPRATVLARAGYVKMGLNPNDTGIVGPALVWVPDATNPNIVKEKVS